MEYPKRLIEVDLPIKQISGHARREKSIRHGHISTLHIWWARRPLAACRAVLCAALWPDPVDEYCPPAFRLAAAEILYTFAEKVKQDSTLAKLTGRHFKYWYRLDPAMLRGEWHFCPVMRYYLLDFLADFANWDAATHPVFLETARALTQAAHESLGGLPGTHPLVVDPFAGGGAIPLEALRVGADAFASDLNPVAVLLNKVVLEYIPRYGQRLADEVRRWGQWIKEQAEQELAEFYPKDADGATPIAYLWARTITCEGPGCGTEIPLMRSFWLAKRKSHSVALQLVPNAAQKRVDFKIVEDPKASEVGTGTVRRGSAQCPVCGYTIAVAAVRRQLKARHGGAADARLFAVVTTRPGEQGRFYRLPTPADLTAAHKAAATLQQRKREHQGTLSLVPDEPLPPQGTLGFRVQLYGMEQWGDLFTPRQALALTTLVRLVRELPAKMADGYERDFVGAVQTCLAFALDKQADSNSSLCAWRSTSQDIGHTFGRQALPILWDFVEGNVLSGATRDWHNAVEGCLKAIESLDEGIKAGNAICSPVIKHPLSSDIAQVVSTDPPYYDAVPYADLSDFFYVWLKRTVGERYPDLLGAALTPKEDECVVDEVKGHDKAYFEDMMKRAMAEGCRIVAPNGICLVVFAHKTTAGWEAQIQAMIEAGWTISGSWPIDTEMGTRLRAQDSAALASSIHLVCRPRKHPDGRMRTNDVGDWRSVLHELPRRIDEWMPRLVKEGVVGADAIFACLGPALEIFSRYSQVERADGTPVALQEYLEFVWAAASRAALRTIFKDADVSGFEPDARLCAVWLWTLSAENAPDENGNGNGKNGKNGSGKATYDVARYDEARYNEARYGGVKEGDVEYVSSDDGAGDAAESDEMEEETEGEEIEAPRMAVPKPGSNGYPLEFDAARKIAQGLGINLDKLNTLVEIKGSTARLRSLRDRARFLFHKGADDLTASVARPPKKAKLQQQPLFAPEGQAEQVDEVTEIVEIPEFTMGATVLDRLHQAMLLYSVGLSDELKQFLKEAGVGKDQRFWRLAVALSSLYPRASDEKRWVDGVQTYKKILGL